MVVEVWQACDTPQQKPESPRRLRFVRASERRREALGAWFGRLFSLTGTRASVLRSVLSFPAGGTTSCSAGNLHVCARLPGFSSWLWPSDPCCFLALRLLRQRVVTASSNPRRPVTTATRSRATA